MAAGGSIHSLLRILREMRRMKCMVVNLSTVYRIGKLLVGFMLITVTEMYVKILLLKLSFAVIINTTTVFPYAS